MPVASRLLDGTFKLPRVKQMENDTVEWDRYMKRYSGKCYRRSCIGALHIWYNDQLFNDMGWNPKRKKAFFAELFKSYDHWIVFLLQQPPFQFRMGLAVSNDMTGGFDHVSVLDTRRFRRALKFVELASDVRTSLDLVVTTKRAAIESFKLAKQLNDYPSEEKPKKTIFDLKLESYEASSKIKILKELRSVTNLDLKAAKELVENMPMRIIKSPFLKNIKESAIKKRMLTEKFGSSKFSFDEDSDLKISSVTIVRSHLYYGYRERMKGSNPLIMLGMDVGYNRMGLAVSNDMTGGFDHVGVLDTHRFRKALKFIELASDVRTSLDLVVTTKRVAIESFKLAKQLDDYVNEFTNMKIIKSPFLKNIKESTIKKRMLTKKFGSSKFSFDEDSDLKFSSVTIVGSHLYYGYRERMKGSNPLIMLGMDVGYNRMGLAVSNDMTGGFDHVGVLDTHRFRKALKFIELASDVRTSLDLVVTTKRAAIESFKLAKQLDDYPMEEKPKKTIFDLKLESYEACSKIRILKELRSVTNLDLKVAKELVENMLAVFNEGMSKHKGE
ncbi:hypothetical protein LWI29_019378 [Acer saccharum]|uniref:Large ribosomal subunit protein bL12 C-terminal domain-containing protein n=1 Tax=Acer saccharum TaxID=4024 RepID=A0AA39RZN2_ACESA|nr:hypothetical protein LWI29_019378 [Acer saccharum]